MAKTQFERGRAKRAAVLGEEYVDSTFAKADDFDRPFQELITEYCWGAVWGRPELDTKTRCLLNLAMLAALNRPAELAVHVRGALRNGCSAEEIREVFLQVAAYCGAPAAADALRIARNILNAAATDKTPE